MKWVLNTRDKNLLFLWFYSKLVQYVFTRHYKGKNKKKRKINLHGTETKIHKSKFCNTGTEYYIILWGFHIFELLTFMVNLNETKHHCWKSFILIHFNISFTSQSFVLVGRKFRSRKPGLQLVSIACYNNIVISQIYNTSDCERETKCR